MEWVFSLVDAVIYILPFLVVFFAVVLFHELGHFWVARRAGVVVEVFSIGMGPEIWAFVDRQGTRWRIAWLPLGGYVRFRGEEKGDGAGSYIGKPVGWRMAIAAAGPAANFILAIVVYAALFMTVGIALTTPRIAELNEGSPAVRAGLEVGDVILAIDGQEMRNFSDVQQAIAPKAGQEIELDIQRGEDALLVTARPELAQVPDGFGGSQRIGTIGIRSDSATEVERQRLGPAAALWAGTEQTAFLTATIASYLGGLIIGTQGPEALGGPLRIAHISSEMAALGLAALLSLIAALSVSLGFLNLLPLPMLDGGHLLYYTIEALRGKPLSERAQEYGFRLGAAALAAIFIFVMWNDFVQLNLFGFGGGAG